MSDMNIDYTTPTLILGATFYGCGLAAAMPEALLVESSISVGSDYAFALLQGEDWSEPLTTTGAEEFRQELIARHALENNQVIPAALAPVLASGAGKGMFTPNSGWNSSVVKAIFIHLQTGAAKKFVFRQRK